MNYNAIFAPITLSVQTLISPSKGRISRRPHSTFFERAASFEARKRRIAALGRLLDGFAVLVVFALVGTEAISVISMRPASKNGARRCTVS